MKKIENENGFFRADAEIIWEDTPSGRVRDGVVAAVEDLDFSGIPNEVLLP